MNLRERMKSRLNVSYPGSKDYWILYIVPILLPLLAMKFPSVVNLINKLNNLYLHYIGIPADNLYHAASKLKGQFFTTFPATLQVCIYWAGYALMCFLKTFLTLYANIFLYAYRISSKVGYIEKTAIFVALAFIIKPISVFLTEHTTQKIFRSTKRWQIYLIMMIGFFPISLFILPLVIIYEFLIALFKKPKVSNAAVGVQKQVQPISNQVAPAASAIQIITRKQQTTKPASENTAGTPITDIDQLDIEGALNEIDSLVGLDEIKEEVKNQIYAAAGALKRKKKGLPCPPINLNSVLLGNPGTGKTDFARIMARIYQKIGLANNKFVELDRSSLISPYIGYTEQKVREAIKEAIGGVLFIDEAYALYKEGSSNDPGMDAVNTLVKEIDTHRGSIIVILAGYREEMMKLLSSNPGLKSRFKYFFHFRDYTKEELIKIYEKFCKDMILELSPDAKIVLEQKIARIYDARTKDFGNARVVRNLFEETLQNINIRSYKSKSNLRTILPEDIDRDYKKNIEVHPRIDIEYELRDFIGMKELKKELQRLVDFAIVQRERAKLGYNYEPISFHMVFTGNPGTGKTTVARAISKIYKELGFLTGGDIVETDRSRLVGGYVGQSELKTAQVIDAAVGHVLFIDEAYSLCPDSDVDFGHRVIEVLLKKMEDYRNNLVVIVAGYKKEMERFLDSNPGLRSRFARVIHFPDYTNEELFQIYKVMVEKDGRILTPEAEEKVRNILYNIPRGENFGNAREIRKLYEKTLSLQSERLSPLILTDRDKLTDKILATIESDDVPSGI